MTRRIFRAIWLVALSVLMAALALSVKVVYDHFTQVQFRQLREETFIAAQAVTNEGIEYLQDLEDQLLSSRITWVDTDGTVLYDTLGSTESMGNHLQRQEIRQALETGFGQATRRSDTVTQQYLYAAQRLPDGTVLRFSTMQSSVFGLVGEMFRFLALVLLAAGILSLVLASKISQQIVKPINEMNLNDPLSNREYEEIQPLLHRMDSQQRQLRAQEIELKRKQKEFNTVVRSLNEGLVLVSSSGTILSINPAAAKLLDVSPNCLGADFSVANRLENVDQLIEQALAGEKGELTLELDQGKVLAAASPVRSEGQVTGVVLLLFDVTEKQRNEELRREFTANVSHELKTPLHAISGFAELMKSGLVPPKDMQDFSGKIYSETQRLILLVEDTLRLSRLDEGAQDLQWSWVDMKASAEAVLRQLHTAAELAGVKLELAGEETVIYAIPQLVSSILFNLVDNAIKYNRPEGRVTVVLHSEEAGTTLTVRDTGIGIPIEHRERIFERFYRVDKSHSKSVGGTGLGLSLVKHAALILNAKVELESEVGKGTEVTVYFPAKMEKTLD